MNIPIHNITTMLMSMTAATYLFCAMVLWLGGWLNNEHQYHSTKLQKFLSVDPVSFSVHPPFILRCSSVDSLIK